MQMHIAIGSTERGRSRSRSSPRADCVKMTGATIRIRTQVAPQDRRAKCRGSLAGEHAERSQDLRRERGRERGRDDRDADQDHRVVDPPERWPKPQARQQERAEECFERVAARHEERDLEREAKRQDGERGAERDARPESSPPQHEAGERDTGRRPDQRAETAHLVDRDADVRGRDEAAGQEHHRAELPQQVPTAPRYRRPVRTRVGEAVMDVCDVHGFPPVYSSLGGQQWH